MNEEASKKKKASKRKNAFYFFMLEKKGELEATGEKFPLCDVAVKMDPEWKALSLEQRQPYINKARDYNFSLGIGENTGRGSMGVNAEDLENLANRIENKEKETLDFIDSFRNIAAIPIILVDFGVYWELTNGIGTGVLPSEVGLSVFSMKNGVYDNFSSLIDPGRIPPEEAGTYGIYDCIDNCVSKTRVPKPCYGKEFQNYKEIWDGISSFIKKHSRSQGGLEYVFCLSSQMLIVETCFQWFCRRTNKAHNFKVLGLELLIQVISIKGKGDFDSAHPVKAHNESLDRACAKMKAVVSGYVAYPEQCPLIQSSGVFLHAKHVDEFLQRLNYAYYPELGCFYHMGIGDGILHCSQNIVNRYAFSLLDAMLTNFGVYPKLGFHYPELNDLQAESRRRKEMLRNWVTVDYIVACSLKVANYLENESDEDERQTTSSSSRRGKFAKNRRIRKKNPPGSSKIGQYDGSTVKLPGAEPNGFEMF